MDSSVRILGILGVIMFFRKDPPQTEGRRNADLLIKTPPATLTQLRELHRTLTNDDRRYEPVPRCARSLPQLGELDAARDPLPECAWSPDEHGQVPVIMLQSR